MIELTPQRINKLEQIVLDYLLGQDLDGIKVSLTSLCARTNTRCRTLYKSIPLKRRINEETASVDEDYPEVDPMIDAILASLNIKKTITEEDGVYEKLLANSENLHDLLKNLYHDGHDHIGYLLNVIESTKPRYDWTVGFLLGAITSAGLGAFAHFNREYIVTLGRWFTQTFPQVVTWLGRTFSILRNIPLLGIIMNLLILAGNWYSTFTNGTTTTPKKLQELFFKTLTAGLTISAYTLAFFAGGVITMPAALLFISSSATKVIKGVYEWWKNSEPDKPNEELPWEIQAEYERAKNLHQRSKKAAFIKIGAAILTTIAVAVWDFFPPSLIFSALCVAFISMTALTEWSIISSINEAAADRLQSAIQDIDNLPSNEIRPIMGQDDAAKLRTQKEKLNKDRRSFNVIVEREKGVIERAELGLALRASELEEQKRQFRTLVSDYKDTIGSSSAIILGRLNLIGRPCPPEPANEDLDIGHHEALFFVPPPAAFQDPDAAEERPGNHSTNL